MTVFSSFVNSELAEKFKPLMDYSFRACLHNTVFYHNKQRPDYCCFYTVYMSVNTRTPIIYRVSAIGPSANNSKIDGVNIQNKPKHAKYETAKNNTGTQKCEVSKGIKKLRLKVCTCTMKAIIDKTLQIFQYWINLVTGKKKLDKKVQTKLKIGPRSSLVRYV